MKTAVHRNGRFQKLAVTIQVYASLSAARPVEAKAVKLDPLQVLTKSPLRLVGQNRETAVSFPPGDGRFHFKGSILTLVPETDMVKI